MSFIYLFYYSYIKKKPAVPNLPVVTDIPSSVSRSLLYIQIPKCTTLIEHSQIIPLCSIFCTLAKRIVFVHNLNYFYLFTISYPVKYTRTGQILGCNFIPFLLK